MPQPMNCGGRRPRWVGGVPRGRARFFKIAAAMAMVVLLLSVWGAVSLAWLAATSLGAGARWGRTLAAVLVVGGITGVGLALAGFVGTMRRVIRPLGGVMDAADRVAGGDYEVRVSEQGPPPIRALARAFNTMTERLQSHDTLRRNLMADVAHELRTPLTVIQGTLEGVIDGVYQPDAKHLQQLLDETHVLSRLVEDLRTLALSESGGLKLQKETIDLMSLTRDVVRTYENDAAARNVAVEVAASDDLPPLDADPVRIREVIGNLLSNALRHTPAGGSVDVRIATTGGDVTVSVRDTGSGMTADEVARAFDRFYKGSSSRGSGLGLTIARGLVEAHGGAIRAVSEPGRGTTIAFTLPGP